MTEHSNEKTSESDVAEDEAQVEPGSDDSYVGRVAGVDEGMTEETGAEARAAGASDNDPVEGGPRR